MPLCCDIGWLHESSGHRGVRLWCFWSDSRPRTNYPLAICRACSNPKGNPTVNVQHPRVQGQIWNSIQSREIEEVELECTKLGIHFDKALSIRKQLMMSNVLKGRIHTEVDTDWIWANATIAAGDIAKIHSATGEHLLCDCGAKSAQCLSAIYLSRQK